MRCVQFSRHGGPEVLFLSDQPSPQPRPGKPVVEVHAVSINPVDWKIRAGGLRPLPAGFPATTGRDGAGIITRVSDGEDEGLVGTRVCFLAPRGVGTWAQEVAVPVESIAVMPPALSMTDAAALPLAGLSAWAGLVETGRVQPGTRVLIHGGSGGVGGMAVPLARHLGAYVLSTCSARNATYVLERGAHEVIPYDEADFEMIAHDIDLIFDLVGGDVHLRSASVLRSGGLLVYLNAAPIGDFRHRPDIGTALARVEPHAAALAEIVRLAADGILRPHVEQVLPFDQFREAHAMAERGLSRGKLVLSLV